MGANWDGHRCVGKFLRSRVRSLFQSGFWLLEQLVGLTAIKTLLEISGFYDGDFWAKDRDKAQSLHSTENLPAGIPKLLLHGL